jgi:uncharacterized protein (TIGR00297 family)
LIFSILSYKKKSLDFQGVLAANFLGIVVFLLGGIESFACLVVFFAAADIATRLGKKRKNNFETRGIGNIIGNGLPAFICLFGGFQFAFFGAISAAFADTLSSEIGMLSKKKPVLITTMKPVEKGIDGGVTLLGYLAALTAGIIIATTYFAFTQNIARAIIIILAGLFGTTIDSFAGASLERRKILGNNAVNFIGSGAGALLAILLSFFIP